MKKTSFNSYLCQNVQTLIWHHFPSETGSESPTPPLFCSKWYVATGLHSACRDLRIICSEAKKKKKKEHTNTRVKPLKTKTPGVLMMRLDFLCFYCRPSFCGCERQHFSHSLFNVLMSATRLLSSWCQEGKGRYVAAFTVRVCRLILENKLQQNEGCNR